LQPPEQAIVDFAARSAPDSDSVACVTGALLGAAYGVEALPVDLAWVVDTLARHLLTLTRCGFPRAALSPATRAGCATTPAGDLAWRQLYERRYDVEAMFPAWTNAVINEADRRVIGDANVAGASVLVTEDTGVEADILRPPVVSPPVVKLSACR
jgi:hypothetical protein